MDTDFNVDRLSMADKNTNTENNTDRFDGANKNIDTKYNISRVNNIPGTDEANNIKKKVKVCEFNLF